MRKIFVPILTIVLAAVILLGMYNGLLGFCCITCGNRRSSHRVDTGQQCCDHRGDDQQRQCQTHHIHRSAFLFHFSFHFFAASFFGAPNLVGLPMRSSSTTQQFMTRIA